MFLSRLRFFYIFSVLLIAPALGACGDDESGDSDGTGTDSRDGVTDTVILPDTFRTETDDAEPDTPEAQPEIIEPGGFGAPCNTNGDCDSGYCVDGPKGYVCTSTCETTCPSGYDCRAVNSGSSDVVFLCLPRLRENCQPCATNFQCQGGVCLEIDGRGGCAYPCSTDEECPDGFSCSETDEEEGMFCQPSTASCTCYAEADGGQRSCTNANDIGECVGIQECDPATGWGPCSAAEATVEVCNGRDDDCDGVWDDELEGANAECVNAVEGVGECIGVQICLGEAGWLCVGATPDVESCNNQDDDCDGAVDEDFRDENGQYVNEDHCGGCGVACAGKIPDATAFCSGAGESPRCEVLECDPGFYQVGPLTCLPVVDNSCVPCLDDSHCTTPGDRCLELDGARFCGRDCAEGNARQTPAGECPQGFVCKDFTVAGDTDVRQCVPPSGSCSCFVEDEGSERPCVSENEDGLCFGTQTCDPENGWTACDAATPVAESCNLEDDNCNGVVDDLPGRFDSCEITNNFGTCVGQLDCRDSATLACVGQVPSTETCNGRDDDCDGETDETEAPLCANQKGVCAGSRKICAGQLGFLACDAGSYGDDYELVELSCDGLDNDCDGKTDEVDLDGDGFSPIACGGTDCDDIDKLSYPGRIEICGDGADNDCNGVVDDLDKDEDGYIAAGCGGPDCNDNAASANPLGEEICGDFIDNDCDGTVDNRDADNDGFIETICAGGTDCDDNNGAVFPGNPEVCDNLDNNCNGITDDRDVDRDGFIAKACGGEDCDDSRPAVNPDVVEVCGNGRDDDCSGIIDDLDVDGDGSYAIACGGNDCDDFDVDTEPGADELWDTKDNDCDGVIDEGVVPLGSIIVTEVMFNPDDPADSLAEYFELTNVAAKAINMKGWTASDQPVNQSVEPDIFDVGVLLLEPGESKVFCVNEVMSTNGGIPCDFDWGNTMQLGNPGGDGEDQIILHQGTTEMHRTVWTLSGSSGQSRSLDPSAFTPTTSGNLSGANWCGTPKTGTYQIGSSDNYGTPGTTNPSCD